MTFHFKTVPLKKNEVGDPNRKPFFCLKTRLKNESREEVLIKWKTVFIKTTTTTTTTTKFKQAPVILYNIISSNIWII